MNPDIQVKGVYLVTDVTAQTTYDLETIVDYAVKGGASVVQYRDKNSSPRQKLETIRILRPMCREEGVMLIVNDRPDLALAGDADGVHLGQKDLPIKETRKIVGSDKIIGGTASTIEEAKEVEAAGADYLGFGHIYTTHTKHKGYAPRGLKMLRQVCGEVKIPVIAIGGIDESRAGEVLKSGAAGFAVSSAICGADNPRKATERLKEIYSESIAG